MKNTYVKPTACAVNIFVENYICKTSGDTIIPVNPNPDETKPAVTNKQNGAWGNIWGK